MHLLIYHDTFTALLQSPRLQTRQWYITGRSLRGINKTLHHSTTLQLCESFNSSCDKINPKRVLIKLLLFHLGFCDVIYLKQTVCCWIMKCKLNAEMRAGSSCWFLHLFGNSREAVFGVGRFAVEKLLICWRICRHCANWSRRVKTFQVKILVFFNSHHETSDCYLSFSDSGVCQCCTI